MAPKTAKLLAGLSNARTRSFVILFGTIILIGIIIAIVKGKKTPESELAKQGSTAVSIPSEIRSTPGSVVSEQYRDLQVAENEKRAQEALKSKTSAIPTIIGAVADTTGGKGGNAGANAQGNLNFGNPDEGANAFGSGKSARDKEREDQEARLRAQRELMEKMRLDKEREAELERQRRLAELAQKEFQAAVQKMAGQMKNYAQGAYADWSKINNQVYVQGDLALEKSDKGMSVTPIPEHAITKSGGKNEKVIKGKFQKPKVFIKAGTVWFGVLDTSVNSDEPGPILATCVGGKYTGTKFVGSFQHQPQQEAVTISFNQMSIPKRMRSTSVQAVAIDPDTARTALATDYDRHLLLRYGSLFASSFIQGYGKAITQQGTTTVSPLTGTTTTSTPPLNNQQIFFAALGELGTQWAQQTKPFFTTPYTVTVDQGTGIGILFLSDVEVTDEG